MLTQQRLRELLLYDIETGLFTWRRAPSHFVKAGSVAGQVGANGYRVIGIDRKVYKAHRLAWLYVHGVWPATAIDHRFGLRDDNRIGELRQATRSENSQNLRGAYSNSSSGVLGVYWHAQTSKWQARIQVNGKAKSLGLFIDQDDASAAYVAAKTRLHPFWAAAQLHG